jgi:hypothetical protein
VSDWKEGPAPPKIGPNDVAEVTDMVMDSLKGKNFGWRGCIGRKEVTEILKQVIV